MGYFNEQGKWRNPDARSTEGYPQDSPAASFYISYLFYC